MNSQMMDLTLAGKSGVLRASGLAAADRRRRRVLMQQVGERQRSEAEPGVLQELPTRGEFEIEHRSCIPIITALSTFPGSVDIYKLIETQQHLAKLDQSFVHIGRCAPSGQLLRLDERQHALALGGARGSGEGNL